jgi:hypothetical protein
VSTSRFCWCGGGFALIHVEQNYHRPGFKHHRGLSTRH